MTSKRTAWLVGTMLATTPAAAQQPAVPLLADAFTDHAVLQRDRPVAVWGRAKPRTRITVSLDTARVAARADAAGRWRASLPAHAAGGPYVLEVAAADGTRQRLTDVMLGDVFLCSGQSNMELAVRQALDPDGTVHGALDDGLRLLHVDHQYGASPFPALKIKSGWAAAGALNLPDFSAACYFMGRELRKTQKVPIGLIEASWGGSTIESWMSTDALRRFGGREREIDLVVQRDRDPAAADLGWAALWEDWWRKTAGPTAGEPWRDPAGDEWRPVPAFRHWQQWGDRQLETYNASLWFRTDFTLTPAQAAQGATLLLGAIDEIDHSWVNGRPVGSTEERGTLRRYTLAPGVLKAGANSLVVNVFDGWIGGGILGPAETRAILLADGTRVPLDGPWRYRRPAPSAEWPPRAPWSALSGFATIGNGMIAPLAPYTLRGVAWYQGESNVYEAAKYEQLLAAWMADWRQRFGQPDLPFLIVQLSAFGNPAPSQPTDEGWGRLRDAQRRAAASDPHAALAVTYDVGEFTDIHPANKQAVGLRLARAARGRIYGDAVSPSGPLPLDAALSGDTIRIRFRDTGGLVTYSARSATGFELCDADAKCRFADAQVAGPDTVTIATGGSTPPRTVRFCWANSPVCNLYDHEGLPVTTFELPVTTAP